MREEKTYREIARGKFTSSDRSFARILIMLTMMLMLLSLVGSMQFNFDVDADGGKHMSVKFVQKSSAPAKIEVPAIQSADELIKSAHQFTDLKNPAKALAFCNKALELEPENMLAYVERSRAHYYLNRYDEAIADAEKVIGGSSAPTKI